MCIYIYIYIYICNAATKEVNSNQIKNIYFHYLVTHFPCLQLQACIM